MAVTVQDADAGDTSTLRKALAEAEAHLLDLMTKPALLDEVTGLQEVVADKGYHSTAALVELEDSGWRPYRSEPDRGRRRWRDDIVGRDAVYANRRRNRGARAKRLQRLRGARVERTSAHLYEIGGLRRTHLRGHENILKRLLLHAGAFDLGRLLRKTLGAGTLRALQGRSGLLVRWLSRLYRACRPFLTRSRTTVTSARSAHRYTGSPRAAGPMSRSTTGT